MRWVYDIRGDVLRLWVSRTKASRLCLRERAASAGGDAVHDEASEPIGPVIYQRCWSIERNSGGGAACGRGFAPQMRSELCYHLGRWDGELDGSRQRSFDQEEIRPSAGEHRKRAYGDEKWVCEAVRGLGLEQTVRPEGRTRKASQSATEAAS